MSKNSKYLFSELDGYLVLESQKRQLRDAVAAAPESLSELNDDEVVDRYVSRFEIAVPKLLEEQMTSSEREVEIDVSRDPTRMFMHDYPNGFHVKGTEITVHVPFTGEGDMFRVRPNAWSTVMPLGRVSDGELLIQYRFPNDKPPSDLKASLDTNLREIRLYLGDLEEMASGLKAQLRTIASQGWQTRKAQFATRTNVLAGLGLPRKSVNMAGPSSSVPASVRSRSFPSGSGPSTHAKNGSGWDAFISHATEDKEEFVKPLAAALMAAGVRVWYDEYALKWGDSLRAKIDEGLARSTFGVVILSPAFFGKHWTEQELNGLAAREIKGTKILLPIWHKIDQSGVAHFSPTLADRMAMKSSIGIPQLVRELVALLEDKPVLS